MKHPWYIIIYSILFVIGCLFFYYQESWIIITFPFTNNLQHSQIQQNITYKTITLYAWQNNKLKQETTEIVYSDNIAQNIKQLLNSWLIFIEDEHLTDQENQAISVALSPSKQEAFICLNKNPFEKQWSTYQKFMWINSLLKTLKNNKIPISAVRLLVHHETLQDDHLNFDISWPITGFSCS